MNCPASANLELAIPGWVPPVRDPDSGAKGVGKKYHEFFANIAELSAKDIAAFAAGFAYLAEVRGRRRFNVCIEETREAWWLVGKPNTTADAVFYTQDELHIIDLKTGKIEVDVVDNKQLLYGAITYAPLAPKAKGVHLHIIQPWAPNGCSSWFADTNVLADFRREAVAAEQKVLAGDTTFGPSDECKFCPAYPHSRGDKGAPLCPATMQMLYPKVVDEDAILGL
jgi:hypothetical protein